MAYNNITTVRLRLPSVKPLISALVINLVSIAKRVRRNWDERTKPCIVIQWGSDCYRLSSFSTYFFVFLSLAFLLQCYYVRTNEAYLLACVSQEQTGSVSEAIAAAQKRKEERGINSRNFEQSKQWIATITSNTHIYHKPNILTLRSRQQEQRLC